MDIFVDTDDCRISYEFNESDTSVFCFTGVGLKMGGISTEDIQREEFRKSITGYACNCVYIIDKKRSWYSSGMVRAEVQRFMQCVHSSWRAEKVIALGNSMGGTGAIAYNDIVEPDITLSFVPQSTVSPVIAPFEERFRKYTDAFSDDHAHTDIASLSPRGNTFIFFGIISTIDLLHAERLADAGYRLFMIRDCGHDAALYLKTKGFLKEIIHLSMTGDGGSLERYLGANPSFIHQESIPNAIRWNKAIYRAISTRPLKMLERRSTFLKKVMGVTRNTLVQYACR